MGIFSRFGDIVNANIVHMLDRAEDPPKLARLIIQEMEDTLVEVKTAAARMILEQKEHDRTIRLLREQLEHWQAKAEFAVKKERDDLARGALSERMSVAEKLAVAEKARCNQEESLAQLRSDIDVLNLKLKEARDRLRALIVKKEQLEHQKKIQETLARASSQSSLDKFDRFESDLLRIESEVDAAKLIGREGNPLLRDLKELEQESLIDDELSALKAKLNLNEASPAIPAKGKATRTDANAVVPS